MQSLCILCASMATTSVLATTNPTNGHDYFLTPFAMSWTEAEAYAVSVGGHLASIGDLEEQQWVEQTFFSAADADRALWIGLTDADEEGVYRWTDNTDFTFANWNQFEPNDSSGLTGASEDYVIMGWHWQYRDVQAQAQFGTWNDLINEGHNVRDGSTEAYFGLVEVVPSPSSAIVVSLGAMFTFFRRRTA